MEKRATDVKRWFWKEIVGIDAGDDFHSNDADADS
jgi:hypothetical protein